MEMLAAMGEEDPEVMEQMMAELMKDPAFAEVGVMHDIYFEVYIYFCMICTPAVFGFSQACAQLNMEYSFSGSQNQLFKSTGW